jgi:hypothetical protein
MSNDYLDLIKESFNPKLITALYRNFSDKYVALQELIDNSVDDRIEGRTLTISISYDIDKDKLILKNDNGKGMDIKDFQQFFQWGASEKRVGKIGRYGQGGKAALGYLAKGFIIQSHPLNSDKGYSIKVIDWENRETGFKEFQLERFNSLRSKEESSVCFEINNLKHTFSEVAIADRIRETYRPLIILGKVEFILNGETILCKAINYDEGTHKKFRRVVKVSNIESHIYGDYGIVADSKSDRGGFRIYQYGRCVAEKEFFGHTDPSKRWNVERLYGELNIDFDLPLLMNKTNIDKDSELWREIHNAMHDEIKGIIKQAADYRTPSTKEIKTVEKIAKQTRKDHAVDIDLTNYGPKLLFKAEVGSKGKTTLKINREHKAYIKWSDTEYGKKLYGILMYSLYEATQDMSKKDAARFLDNFSEILVHNSVTLTN